MVPDARDLSPEPQPLPYDDLEDDLGDWTRDRSPTPVHDAGAGSSSKPRKRLLKKGGGGADLPGDDGLEDWGLEDADAGAAAKKGKGSSSLRDMARGGSGMEKKRRREDNGREKRRFSGGKASGGGDGHRFQDDDGEREIRELWDTIAGGDSEVSHSFLLCLPLLLLRQINLAFLRLSLATWEV
jgi:transcription factor SPN1